jgi:hypothetical protein
MANKFPYVSSSGPITKTVDHLRRKSFPKEVTADTLRRLGVAPKNESYVINVLRFLGVIDAEGKKVDEKTNAFVQHQDEAFQSEFAKLVRDAYADLFDLHGEDAWKMDRSELTQFFRSADHTSDLVGSRQAGTFMHLAGVAGKGEALQTPTRRQSTKKVEAPIKRPAAPKVERPPATKEHVSAESRVGLTVRIEVNLPADGDQQTYDRIFKSIRKNLIDGE